MAINKPEKETKSEKQTLDAKIQTGTSEPKRSEGNPKDYSNTSGHSKKDSVKDQQEELKKEKEKQESLKGRIGGSDSSADTGRKIDKALGVLGNIGVGNTSVGGLTKSFVDLWNKHVEAWQGDVDLHTIDYGARNHTHPRLGFNTGWNWNGTLKNYIKDASAVEIEESNLYKNKKGESEKAIRKSKGKGVYNVKKISKEDSGNKEGGKEGDKEKEKKSEAIDVASLSFVGKSNSDKKKNIDREKGNTVSSANKTNPNHLDRTKPESTSNYLDAFLSKYLKTTFIGDTKKELNVKSLKYARGSFRQALRAFSELPSPISPTQFVMLVQDAEQDNWYPLGFRVKTVKLPELARSSKDTFYGDSAISLPVNNLVAEKSFSASIILDQEDKTPENKKYYTILQNLLSMFGYVEDSSEGWNLNMLGNFKPRTFDKAVLFVVPGWVFHGSSTYVDSTRKAAILPELDSYLSTYNNDKTKTLSVDPENSYPVYVFDRFRISAFKLDFSFDTSKNSPWEATGTFTYTDVHETDIQYLGLDQLVNILNRGEKGDGDSSNHSDLITGEEIFRLTPNT